MLQLEREGCSDVGPLTKHDNVLGMCTVLNNCAELHGALLWKIFPVIFLQ